MNSVTFYKNLVLEVDKTVETEARERFYYLLGPMLESGYSRDLFNYTAVDKRSRLAFVNWYLVPPLLAQGDVEAQRVLEDRSSFIRNRV